MKLDKKDLLLYAVTDRHWLAKDETLYSVVEKALKGGATFMQLREKNLEEEAFIEEARESRPYAPATLCLLSSTITWISLCPWSRRCARGTKRYGGW